MHPITSNDYDGYARNPIRPKVELKAVIEAGRPTRLSLVVVTDETRTTEAINNLLSLGRSIVEGF